MQANMRGASDIGRRREHNEDTFLVDEALGLALVADGMGGHACGEIASRLAADTFREAVLREQNVLDAFASGADEAHAEEVQAALENAMLAACATVFGEAERDAGKHGMGTTCTAVIAVGGLLFGAHVGDSRAYLVRGGRALQLTRDHTILAQLVALGRLTSEQAAGTAYAGYRNALARAVGVTPEVEVDTYAIDLLPGDVVFLASDGLTAYLTAEELATFAATDHADLAERLIDVANERGGHDNITVVTLQFVGVSEEDRQTSAAVAAKVSALSHVPMFALLDPVHLLELAALATLEQVEAGTVLVREGDPGDALFALLSGAAKRESEAGDAQALGPDEHFGELSLLDEMSREATVTTTKTSRLMRLEREALAAYLERAPQVGVQLLWSLARFVSQRDRGESGEGGGSGESDPAAPSGSA